MELGSQRSVAELLAGLTRSHSQRVVYRQNGNRCEHADVVLARVERLLGYLGITRVAEISQLTGDPFPVFQSVRPNLIFHPEAGQNAGAQGKGLDPTQAKISCIMESVEGYCAEPKVPMLVRGSYQDLVDAHPILDPIHYLHRFRVPIVQSHEPLMFTQAASLELEHPVLVPAELAYFPFFATDYATRPLFPCSTNGLAAGSSYAEAVLHGLYEVIERHYVASADMGRAGLEMFRVGEISTGSASEPAVFYALEFPGARNLAVIACMISVPGAYGFAGLGCASSVSVAADRAYSEARQSMAVHYSGTREDIDGERRHQLEVRTRPEEFRRLSIPRGPTLSLQTYRDRIGDTEFDDLQAEISYVMNWLHASGFQNVLVVNLTRVGIEVPVVKVIVPGLLSRFEHALPSRPWTTLAANRMRFGFDRDELQNGGFS